VPTTFSARASSKPLQSGEFCSRCLKYTRRCPQASPGCKAADPGTWSHTGFAVGDDYLNDQRDLNSKKCSSWQPPDISNTSSRLCCFATARKCTSESRAASYNIDGCLGSDKVREDVFRFLRAFSTWQSREAIKKKSVIINAIEGLFEGLPCDAGGQSEGTESHS